MRRSARMFFVPRTHRKPRDTADFGTCSRDHRFLPRLGAEAELGQFSSRCLAGARGGSNAPRPRRVSKYLARPRSLVRARDREKESAERKAMDRKSERAGERNSPGFSSARKRRRYLVFHVPTNREIVRAKLRRSLRNYVNGDGIASRASCGVSNLLLSFTVKIYVWINTRVERSASQRVTALTSRNGAIPKTPKNMEMAVLWRKHTGKGVYRRTHGGRMNAHTSSRTHSRTHASEKEPAARRRGPRFSFLSTTSATDKGHCGGSHCGGLTYAHRYTHTHTYTNPYTPT